MTNQGIQARSGSRVGLSETLDRIEILSAATGVSAAKSVWNALEALDFDPLAAPAASALIVSGPSETRDFLVDSLSLSGPAIALSGERCRGFEAIHLACRLLVAGDCRTAIVTSSRNPAALLLRLEPTAEPDDTRPLAAIEACVSQPAATAVETAWAISGNKAEPASHDGETGLAGLLRRLAESEPDRPVAYLAEDAGNGHAVCLIVRRLREDLSRLALQPADLAEQAPPPSDRPHPIIGAPVASPLREIQFAATLGVATHPWLADHRVFDRPIFPAAAMIEAMIAAAQAGPGWPAAETVLRNLHIRRALAVDPSGMADLALVLTPEGDETFNIALHARPAGGADWVLNAAGTLQHVPADPMASADLKTLRRGLRDEVPIAEHFADNTSRGIEYGPAFQGLGLLCRGRGRAMGLLHRPADATGSGHLIHPAVIDAAIQTVPPAFEAAPEGAFVPVAIDEVRILETAEHELWCEATAHRAGAEGRTRVADLRIFDAKGHTVLALNGIELVHTTAEALTRAASESASTADDKQPPEAVTPTPQGSLAGLLPAERLARLNGILADEVKTILGLPQGTPLDRSAGFFTIGLDSIAIADLHRRLQPRLGISFPADAIFDHPTIAALTDFLAGRFTTPAEEEKTAPQAANDPIETMSMDEAESELLKEIDKAYR